MKALSNYILEKLVINKNYKSDKIVPKDPKDLYDIVHERIKKEGPGTKKNPIDFNDIDTSNIKWFTSLFFKN